MTSHIKLLFNKSLLRVLVAVVLVGVLGIAVVRTLLRLIPSHATEQLNTHLIGYEGWSAAGLIFAGIVATVDVCSYIRKRSNFLTIGRIDWLCYLASRIK